ncbi:MAG: 4'-phosphopantetheinyl transferase family protein, partial [Actinomycetota bacterium]
PEFSLTRAGGLVAVCLSASRVGLDAERSQGNVEELIASEVFSDEDRVWIGAGPRAERFLRLWVAKEAIGKGSGLGLVEAGTIRIRAAKDGWCPAVDALGVPCSVAAVTIPGAAAAALATFGECSPLVSRTPEEDWLDRS